MKKRSAKPGRAFFEAAPAQDLFVQEQRQAKLLDYVGALAGIDELFDFAAMAAKLDEVCPAGDRSKGGRPAYATEVLVRMVMLQGLYIRAVTLAHNTLALSIKCAMYNARRLVWLERQEALA